MCFCSPGKPFAFNDPHGFSAASLKKKTYIPRTVICSKLYHEGESFRIWRFWAEWKACGRSQSPSTVVTDGRNARRIVLLRKSYREQNREQARWEQSFVFVCFWRTGWRLSVKKKKKTAAAHKHKEACTASFALSLSKKKKKTSKVWRRWQQSCFAIKCCIYVSSTDGPAATLCNWLQLSAWLCKIRQMGENISFLTFNKTIGIETNSPRDSQ